MKKMRKPIFLTLLIMAGLTVGAYFLLSNKESGTSGEFQNRIAEEQNDLQTDRAYQYDIGENAVLLSRSGEDKNVLNFDQTNVYDVKNSNTARDRLDRLIKRSDASFDNPIIACNPFGTNENTLYFYFTTSYRCMIRYTITVEDESISDHVRYVDNGQEGNLSKEHEFVISGMVPGRTNYIIVELLDANGSKREGKTYQYEMPSTDLPVKLTTEDGHSKETCDSGVYTVLSSHYNKIGQYDNQGVLRNVTVTEKGNGKRIYQSGDSIIYQVSGTKVAKVSSIGRVTGVVQIKGYGKIRDFSYDGYNEVYLIAKKKNRDYLLAVSFKTGKTRVVYRFPKTVKLQSLGTPQGGKIGLASSKPKGSIWLDGITGAKPKISSVYGKKSEWKKIWKKKKNKEQKDVDTGTVSETVSGHDLKMSASSGVYAEYSKDGKLIRQFDFGTAYNAVVKMTLGDICFYGI